MQRGNKANVAFSVLEWEVSFGGCLPSDINGGTLSGSYVKLVNITGFPPLQNLLLLLSSLAEKNTHSIPHKAARGIGGFKQSASSPSHLLSQTCAGPNLSPPTRPARTLRIPPALRIKYQRRHEESRVTRSCPRSPHMQSITTVCLHSHYKIFTPTCDAELKASTWLAGNQIKRHNWSVTRSTPDTDVARMPALKELCRKPLEYKQTNKTKRLISQPAGNKIVP